MADIIIIWSAFAVATWIMSIWRLYSPTWKLLAEDHSFRKYPKLLFLSWTIITLIIAPLLIPVIVVDEYQQAYIKGFVGGSE